MTALAHASPVARWVSPAAVGLAAIGACAVLAVVDPNVAGRYPVCPFKLATGLDCPGCGTLRAVHALTGGDVVRALDHNLLTVLLLPVLAWAWVGWFLQRLGRRAEVPTLPASVAYGLAATLTVFWVVRNVPVDGVRWLASGLGG